MYSRRDFGRVALAGLPLALGAAPKLDSVIRGVQIGAQSYSFRDRPLDDAIKAFAECGLGECELWQGHAEPKTAGGREGREKIRQWRTTVALSEFEAIRKKFDAAGIRLFAYNYSFSADMTDAEITRGFEMAKALGVKVITASATLKAAEKVAPIANRFKIQVGMHGHSNIKDPNEFARPESFAAAMKMSRYFGVNLDVGHFFAAGFDPVAYIQENHARIVCLHLKDRKKDQGENMPLGEGDTPLKQVLTLLRDKKWKIPANIEYEYKGQDSVAEVKKCFAWCKQALA
jgi:sugar phosphate isomerase/epimerase